METNQIPVPCPTEKQVVLSVDKPVDNCLEGGHYLDTYDKVCNHQQNNGLEQSKLKELVSKFLFHSGHIKEADRLTNCGQNWLPFACSGGHAIYQQITCGLPYCPTCSKSGSAFNKRRAKRVGDMLLGFPMLGHLVLTLPKEISEGLPSSEQINKLYNLAWKILQEFFDAEASVIVLHLCGDKTSGLHLHFDCSFPILYRNNGDCSYPLIMLQLARAEWTVGVNRIFDAHYTDTVLHYNFVNTLEQEYHLIKYITRSTIPADKFIELPNNQKEYCIRINKAKTIRYFGKFVGKKKVKFLAQYRCSRVIRKPEEDLIEQRICPICKEKMKPSKPVWLDDIPVINFVRYQEYLLVDKEIYAYMRDKEKKIEPVYDSLLEYLISQENNEGSNA